MDKIVEKVTRFMDGNLQLWDTLTTLGSSKKVASSRILYQMTSTASINGLAYYK